MTNSFDTIIVGGGLSGLTVAHKLRHHQPQHSLMVLEQSSTTGGVVLTHRENGFIAENGPHGFLDNCSESKEILQETGLDKECVKAPLIDFVRYVYLHGTLQCIPQTPLKIAKAPLIPFKDKLRVLGEMFASPLEGEPTVAKWVNHRFGPALLPFADAIFTGTYAGDFNRLTIDGVMPGVRALEKKHGSVIKGVFAKMRAAKKGGKKGKKTSMPGMTSFPGGMQRLVERLAEPLTIDKDLLLECGVLGVAKTDAGYQVETDRGQFTAANLVLAIPTNKGLELLKDFAAPPNLTAIPEAWIATVLFGFGPSVTLPPGFGYLAPECENRFALGALFSSNMFPNRAPEGSVLFEALVGGRRHPERLQLSEEELIANCLEDVREVLDITEEPLFTRVLQPNGAIPQLEDGYPELLKWRNGLVDENPGLHICGFGWDGIGLNDMMKSATRVATSIRQATTGGKEDPEVKKVYF